MILIPEKKVIYPIAMERPEPINLNDPFIVMVPDGPPTM